MPDYKVTIGDQVVEVKIDDCEQGAMRVTVGEKSAVVTVEQVIELPAIHLGPAAETVPGTVPIPLENADGALRAKIAGTVVAVRVKPGAEVRAGDVLLTLEAMKMENEVRAAVNGTVKSVAVESGDPVKPGDIVVQFERS